MDETMRSRSRRLDEESVHPRYTNFHLLNIFPVQLIRGQNAVKRVSLHGIYLILLEIRWS
jgi:hypothetical protein